MRIKWWSFLTTAAGIFLVFALLALAVLSAHLWTDAQWHLQERCGSQAFLDWCGWNAAETEHLTVQANAMMGSAGLLATGMAYAGRRGVAAAVFGLAVVVSLPGLAAILYLVFLFPLEPLLLGPFFIVPLYAMLRRPRTTSGT